MAAHLGRNAVEAVPPGAEAAALDPLQVNNKAAAGPDLLLLLGVPGIVVKVPGKDSHDAAADTCEESMSPGPRIPITGASSAFYRRAASPVDWYRVCISGAARALAGVFTAAVKPRPGCGQAHVHIRPKVEEVQELEDLLVAEVLKLAQHCLCQLTAEVCRATVRWRSQSGLAATSGCLSGPSFLASSFTRN